MSHLTRRTTTSALAIALTSAGILTGCSGDYIPPVPPSSDGPTPPYVPDPTPPEPPDPVVPDDSIVITQSGLGPLEVGGSLSSSDVEEYLGLPLYLAPQTAECSLGISEETGIAIMTTPDLATMAFVVANPDVRTAEGIGAGSTVADVLSTYGDHVVPSYSYPSQTGGPQVLVEDLSAPAGAVLTDDTRLFVFDTDTGGSVTRIRAGMWPWVGYLDYCSEEASRPAETGWPLTR